MKETLIRLENSQRAINLLIQAVLIIVLLFGYGIDTAVPFKFIVWQLVHFSLIAISDFYFDDYPHKRASLTAALYLSFPLFIIYSISIGAFDELFIRIHIIIIIIGSLLGNKIDQPFWKILSVAYLLIVVLFEFKNNEIQSVLMMVTLYTLGSIFLVAITERLSEINRNFWIINVAALFIWITFKGPFYEQSFIYLVAGIPYESSKILFNHLLSDQSTVNNDHQVPASG
ncbi:MAG: hypothetical protein AAGG75_22445 [Bacteroidota bacterium]